ncbi:MULTISPECIES: hypothetical protein [Cupriavidus]|jgi:hypothetical protein|uniref:hypothetical protein n=1 Tax=Cupriavidus TaxID=106589 RepID=UPI00046705C0|nr:hypothetical protein [Cupriavidus metallidurans]AVA38323.1 hypothetical protein C3Z06_32480 [Cupriavidus metallidurans]KWW32325.1 hypothetical protein AU374_05925 [Cupriavidus metallidurans]
MLIRSKNPLASFNRRSREEKDFAIADGCQITREWNVEGYECWHAEKPQAVLKSSLPGNRAEAGACVNDAPRIWYTYPGCGHVFETVIVSRTA